MIALLVGYCVVVGTALAAAGIMLEWAAGAWHWPRRWVWVAVLAASVGVGLGIPWRTAPDEAAELGGDRIASQTPRPLGLPAGVAGDGHATVASTRRVSTLAGVDLASLRDRVEPAARSLWPMASLAVLVAYVAGHAVLARRRRQWRRACVRQEHVLLSPETGPAVVGIWRPDIVLPEWALACGPHALDLMLRHEGEHQRARDPLLIQLARLAAVVMPWNPATWWMLSRLKLAIEMDCDARVLGRRATGAAAAAYGELLLGLASRGSAGRSIFGHAMLERSSTLARRIVAMYPARGRFAGVRGAFACAPAVALVAGVFLVPAPALHGQAARLQDPTLPAPPVVDVWLPAPPRAAEPERTLVPLLRQREARQREGGPQTEEPVYTPGNGVSWPRPIKQPEPQYTQAAKDAKIQGTVYLTAVVRTDGTVGQIKVTRSLDKVHGLDDAAITAASQWRFTPCTREGKPVRCAIELEMEFRLH